MNPKEEEVIYILHPSGNISCMKLKSYERTKEEFKGMENPITWEYTKYEP